MKKFPIITVMLAFLSFNINAQTKTSTTTTTKKTTTTVKKPTTTTKPAAKTTTATQPTTTKTTTTVAKPTTTTAPSTTTTTKVAPVAETPVVKEPTGPPVTGAVTEGPKSYSNTTSTTTTTTKKETVAKTTAAPKVDTKRKTDDRVRSYFGIRGGYNLATVAELDKLLGGASNSSEYLPGYMGGLFLNLGISKSFSIQPEFLYSQQGFQISEGGEYLKAKLDVAQVPILLKLALGGEKVKFLINAGPYVGYKLKQSMNSNLGGIEINSSEPFDTDDADGSTTNRLEYGAIGGAGFQFKLGGALLSLEGRYNYGLSDPVKYTGTKPAEAGNMGYHRVITGTVGLAFPIGR